MSDRVNSDRKAFLRIDEDPLDEAADRVALAKNIPTLTMPSPEETQRAPLPVAETRAPLSSIAKGRAPEPKSLAEPSGSASPDFFRVRCPDYLTEQLEARRAELRARGRKVTLSYLVMKALRADGYSIRDEDFVEDGRRLR